MAETCSEAAQKSTVLGGGHELRSASFELPKEGPVWRRPRGRKASPAGTCQKGPGGDPTGARPAPVGTCQKGPGGRPHGSKASPVRELAKKGQRRVLQFAQLPKTFMNIDESKVVCYVDGEVLDADWHKGKV